MRKFVVIGYAASVLLVAAMGWALYRLTTDAIQSAAAVNRTLRVLERISGIDASLAQAESLQRGFLLYAEEEFIQERDQQLRAADRFVNEVVRLVDDNPVQRPVAAQLLGVLREREERMRTNEAARRQLGRDAPVMNTPTQGGRQISSRLYGLTAQMRDTEMRLLEFRQREEAERFAWMRGALLATLILCVAIVIPGWALSLRTARARAQAERTITLLAESLPGAVFQYRVLADGSARYELLSSATERIRGVDRAAALRDPRVIFDTILEPDRTRLLEKIAGYQRSMQPMVADFRANVRGQVRWIRTVAAPRKEMDGSVVWSGHWDDITTRHELQEQFQLSKLEAEEANRAKSTFLATMSHEIRTPMNGVLGMLELLALTKLDQDQQTTLSIIRESGRSLLRIIDDILDFSKIEAGKLDLVPEATSVREVVDRVWGMYTGTASSKGLLLRKQVDERISPSVMADPVRLQQILANFVSNALKFTSVGGASISATLTERRDGRDHIRFVVEDSGVGMSPEQQARVFQPFSQAHDQRASRYGGTGLGLSISRRLAELMGGSILMESDAGHGTRLIFDVSFPIADGQPATKPAAHAAPAIDARPAPTVEDAEREGRLILVVDDHPINRMVLLRQVNTLGYAAESAEDGIEAWEKWSSRRFAAVITDVNMPGLDGYSLARDIRNSERAQGLPRTPIIACTANALGGEAEKCFGAGMDDYVAKPVTLEQLSEKLARWLPHSAGPPSGSALDRAVLAEATSGDEALRRDLLVRFQHYNRADSAQLREAMDDRDSDRIALYAHRIKGASRAIGANALGNVCSEIERFARAGDLDAAIARGAALAAELARLDEEIETEARSSTPLHNANASHRSDTSSSKTRGSSAG